MKQIPAVLNNTGLKLIALVSMIIDHTCIVLFARNPAAAAVRMSIGRIAMPLYVFLICEGFHYTRNRFRYGRNLLIFALVSEPVYDLARYGKLEFSDQNVLFTMFLGLLLLCVLDRLERYFNPLYFAAAVAGFMGLSWALHCDYEYAAMLVFAAFYMLRRQHVLLRDAAGCAILTAVYSEPAAFLSMIPLAFYNGKRGRVKGRVKYLFYVAYPAHLMVLWILKSIVF